MLRTGEQEEKPVLLESRKFHKFIHFFTYNRRATIDNNNKDDIMQTGYKSKYLSRNDNIIRRLRNLKVAFLIRLKHSNKL